MIRILCGRQGSGKTEQILRHIAALPRTERIYLTVPEQFTFETERMLFDMLGTEGVMHVQVVSLQRLAYLIGSKTALKERTILTQEGKGLIVKRIVDECEGSFEVYRGVSGKNGFLDRVVRFVGELKENAVSADLLNQIAKDETDGTLKGKLSDLGIIYEKYEEILSRDYIDPQDYLTECAQYVSHDPDLKDSRFFFDGFHTFDRSAYPLIESIMAVCASAEFTLTFGEDEFFSVTADTLRSLRDCAEQANRTLELVQTGTKQIQSPEMAFLEEHVMGYEPVAYHGSSEAVNLTVCENEDTEIETVASEILRLVRDGHYRFSDISVIVPDLDAYAQPIEDVFAQKEIACFVDKRKPIIYSSPVRAFLFLVSMTDRTLGGTELIAFAKTGFSDIQDEACMLLENYALECGIRGSMWEKEFTRNNREQSYDLNEMNRIRTELLRPVLLVRDAVKDAVDMKDYCTRLHGALEAWGFREKIRDCSSGFAEAGDHESSNTYAQIYNKILSVLDQAYDFFGQELFGARAFHDMLAYALAQATVGIIPSTIDKVTVGDIRRSRAGSIKVLFVLGANEGMLPSDTSDQGILSEDEKQSVRTRGLDLVQTADYNRTKEEFLIYTLLSKPSERCYVSRYLRDTSGEECAPSSVFERMKELFPDIRIRTDYASDSAEELEKINDRHTALMRLSARLSARTAVQSEPDGFDALYDDVYAYFLENDPAKAELLAQGLSFDNAANLGNTELMREAMPLPVSLSVSRLETYAECPFRFFAEYLINPTKRREHEVRSTDIGSVLHRAVELYSRQILDHTVDPQHLTQEELGGISRAITEQVLAEYHAGLFSQIAKSPYLRTKLMRAAESAITEITRQLNRSDFLLTETEAKFRFGGTYQPICVDVEGVGRVYLQGIIDRIDTYESGGTRYVKIIDYKTGSREFDITKAYYGLSMQLPVYLSAATSGEDAAKAAGVFYFRIKPPLVKLKKEADEEEIARKLKKSFALRGIALKDVEIIKAMDNEADRESFLANVSIKDGTLKANDALIEPELFDVLLDHTLRTAEQAASDMLSGKISVAPYRYGKEETACKWCDYPAVCKFSEGFRANGYREIRKKKAEDLYGQANKTETEERR